MRVLRLPWLVVRATFAVLAVLGLIETVQGAPASVDALSDAGVASGQSLGVVLTVIASLVLGLAALGPHRIKYWIAVARNEEPWHARKRADASASPRLPPDMIGRVTAEADAEYQGRLARLREPVQSAPQPLVARSDAQLIATARAEARELANLFGQHARYHPKRVMHQNHEEAQAARPEEERQRQSHEQATLAKFFEERYANVHEIAMRLYGRQALTKRELRGLLFQTEVVVIATTMIDLGRIPPLLIRGAQRLETGDLPAQDEEP